MATFVSNIHSVGSFGADISIRSGGLLITPQANAALPPSPNSERPAENENSLISLFFFRCKTLNSWTKNENST